MNKSKTKNLTLLSLFIAIEVLMTNVPFLGFIPIGPLRATTLHIPVIIAGIVLGKDKGAIIGFVFGLCSLLTATMQPTATSFIFSPFISGSFLSAIVAIVPRVCIGYVAGFIYDSLKEKHKISAMAIGSFLGAITNTILVMSGIYFLYKDAYAAAQGIDPSALIGVIGGIIGFNGVIEALLSGVIVSAVGVVLNKMKPIK